MSDKKLQKDRAPIESWEIGEVFDEMSDKYSDVMDHMVPHYRKLISAMLEQLPDDFAPAHILDLGCGNGNVSSVSMARFPNATHHLVDASDEMIGLCQERFKDSSNTYELNLFQNLDLQVNKYDLVLAGFSLHHLDGDEKQKFFPKLFLSMTDKSMFTCADLFVNKEDEEHEEVLTEWKKFIYSSGKAPEDWDWLMDHYTTYDRPNAFVDQQAWLSEAGFSRTVLSWNHGPWGCYHAFKT